jgi:hypothetical protein
MCAGWKSHMQQLQPKHHQHVFVCCALQVVVALLVALLAVRALGQTDLNPVSGVGKISQVGLKSNIVCNIFHHVLKL